jgi:hypothetical protein
MQGKSASSKVVRARALVVSNCSDMVVSKEVVARKGVMGFLQTTCHGCDLIKRS